MRWLLSILQVKRYMQPYVKKMQKDGKTLSLYIVSYVDWHRASALFPEMNE